MYCYPERPIVEPNIIDKLENQAFLPRNQVTAPCQCHQFQNMTCKIFSTILPNSSIMGQLLNLGSFFAFLKEIKQVRKTFRVKVLNLQVKKFRKLCNFVTL